MFLTLSLPKGYSKVSLFENRINEYKELEEQGRNNERINEFVNANINAFIINIFAEI